MERTLDVRTPESIAFSYELAGIGSRFLAVLLDLLIQFAVLALIIWGLYEIGVHAPGNKHAVSSSVAQNIAYAVIVGIIFIVFFAYFIIFEAFWNGQTPGKRALGIRVVRDGGYPLDFTASLVRNLIRVGELTVGFYAISGIVAVLSEQNKRLGDIAAGTIVVRDTRMDSPEALLREVREEPVYASTAYVSGEERAIVKRFLERREDLIPERRMEIARQLAERVRPRVPQDLQRLDDESLLERL
ncbi:MAG TPA: RDD family protein [Candidatus Baltobacteraceae bacterium]|nr:RDD family protein [Candidatus Baltobacteraceae bacterium]